MYVCFLSDTQAKYFIVYSELSCYAHQRCLIEDAVAPLQYKRWDNLAHSFLAP